MMDSKKKHLINGILTVVGAVFIQFAFGYFYTVSNMTPYILSYIKERVDNQTNDGLTVWLSGLGYGAQGMTMPLGGFLAKKVDYRIIVAIGCIVQSGSIMLTNLAVQHSFGVVIVTYAVLTCGGLGMAYSVVIEVSGAYFPKKYGMIVGIVVGGYGLSSLVFTPLQTAYINPREAPFVNGVMTDPAVLDRVPTAFLVFGGVTLALETIGCLLLRARPTVKSAEKELEMNESEEDSEKTSDTVNLRPLQVLRQVDFYLLFFILMCMIITISVLISNYKYFGAQNISDDKFLSTIAAITSVFNCLGRVIWGLILDKLSFKVPLIIILCWFGILMITFPHFAGLAVTPFKALYVLWLIQLFFCLSGTFTLFPTATKFLFGPKYMSVNYGILFNACFVGSIIIGGVLSSVDISSAFVALFSSCGALCFGAILIAIWVRDNKMPAKLNICRWCSKQCGRDDEEDYISKSEV